MGAGPHATRHQRAEQVALNPPASGRDRFSHPPPPAPAPDAEGGPAPGRAASALRRVRWSQGSHLAPQGRLHGGLADTAPAPGQAAARCCGPTATHARRRGVGSETTMLFLWRGEHYAAKCMRDLVPLVAPGSAVQAWLRGVPLRGNPLVLAPTFVPPLSCRLGRRRIASPPTLAPLPSPVRPARGTGLGQAPFSPLSRRPKPPTRWRTRCSRRIRKACSRVQEEVTPRRRTRGRLPPLRPGVGRLQPSSGARLSCGARTSGRCGRLRRRRRRRMTQRRESRTARCARALRGRPRPVVSPPPPDSG